MNNGSDYDFIIIGSGAGGGTLAYRLAPSGKRILLIERGPFVRREKENWNSLEVNARGRYNTKELWRNADGTELHPHTNYYVGGNTKFYGAALFRLRERDFGEIKHYGGTSPAWPISYDELEPYYTDTKVTRLETDTSGREVTAVHVERNGAKESYSAKFVIVSGGAINSAALLLRSANDKHPNGLANGSDVVGRHYMGHVNSVLMALSKCPNPTVFQKTLSVNDFYFSSPEWEFPMGHISFVGKLDGDTLKAGAPKVAPKWTLDLMGKHSLDFWLTSEDLPDPNNRVTINRDGELVLQYKPNNEEGHKRLIKKLESLMQQQTKCSVHGHDCHEGLFARNLYLGQRIPLAGVAHQNGTIRFGNDRKTSAIDRNCKAHELDNLYVVDASFFPSSGAVNPGLTIIANALRVGDHLLERMNARRTNDEATDASTMHRNRAGVIPAQV